MSLFIELTQGQINKLQSKGLLHTKDGIMRAKINGDSDPVPVKLKGQPDPEINFKSGVGDGFRESAAKIRACRETAFRGTC
jgi:hypothetical protein